MLKHLFSLALFAITFSLGAQNISVQTFDYKSSTRDTIIEFPDIDHNDYEKIIMHYSMRCKDALVSTGSERNKGCGEWDYSCNTYIVDESRVDSLKQTNPEYEFVGRGGDVFNYTDEQTYSYVPRLETEVNITNLLIERSVEIINGTQNIDYGFASPGSQMTVQYVLKAEDLIDLGLKENNQITGLSFPVTNGEITLSNLKVHLIQTAETEFNEEVSNGDWELVSNRTTTLNASENLVSFFTKYEWDGVSNLAVSMSYDNATGSGIDLQGDELAYAAGQYIDASADKSWAFGTSGYINLQGDLSDINDEITISFWQFGYDVLPRNSTLLEGVDAGNNREVNIHLPWGDSNVYWDCGNEGGYDRISGNASAEDYKGKWNHWAFIKNTNTGLMQILVNGEIFAEGTDKFKKIDIQNFNLGGNGTNNYNYGQLEEFQIYDKALSQDEIRDWMSQSITSDHPSFDNLKVYYNFNSSADQLLEDLSGNGNDGLVIGQLAALPVSTELSLAEANQTSLVPNFTFRQDALVFVAEEIIVHDAIPDLPQKVNQYEVVGTDLESVNEAYYYSAESSYLRDFSGNILDSVTYSTRGTLEAGLLNYYSKRPMEFEIMSFVTPYGIGIDFGEEGHTWTFDVTHLGPILKGQKRMYMTRGGQWQEEMDVRFEYIKGTPDRDVLNVQNIWPTGGRVGFGNIQSDWRFEPRELVNDDNVAQYEVNMSITGHGQDGEFIPRNHTLKVGGELGDFTETWTVWKECAENPIYPQGGTWVYDRAGWCPGMATDIKKFDFTEYFRLFQKTTLDYNIPVVSGASGYIISSQLISYGPPNKTMDLAIEDVLYPSSKIEHGRFNPTCTPPRILLKNHGSEAITNARIVYGVVGKSESYYEWTGNLPFLDETEVELHFLADLTVSEPGDMFFARILSINNAQDEYPANDEYVSEIQVSDHYNGDLIIEMRTNFASTETVYRVFDRLGDQVLFQGGNLSANTSYFDTLSNLNGCYTIMVEDSDEDGISWWANNDGNGYIRVKEDGGAWKNIATDFGKFVEYNFTLGFVSSVNEPEIVTDVKLFPNPSSGEVFVENLKGWNNEVQLFVQDLSGRVVTNQRMQTQNLLDNGVPGISELEAGVYFVNLFDGDRKAVVKFIKVNSSR